MAEARHRVTTVANVHDHLHRSAEDDKASVAQFLTDLADALSQNRSAHLEAIAVEADATKLPSEKVMALGLAVNELVANAIKHGDANRIAIGFKTKDDHAVLRVTDDGPGLPADFDPKASKGLGMRVLNSLAQQLHGTLMHEKGSQGTSFTIRFPLTPRSSGADGTAARGVGHAGVSRESIAALPAPSGEGRAWLENGGPKLRLPDSGLAARGVNSL